MPAPRLPPAPAWRAPLVPGAAVLGALAVATLTVRSPQLGCAVALVGGVVAAYAGRPAVGLLALWTLWLTVPALRRVLGAETGYVTSDPLSVAPFLATLAVAAVALARTRLPRAPKVVLALAGLGFALGVPASVDDPAAAAFALIAYGAGVAGFVLGWVEADEDAPGGSLERALVVLTPPLVLYGLYQYFVALPPWDATWLDDVSFSSVGSPEEGRVRIFATLNSPGLLGVVLAIAVLVIVARRRVGPLAVATLALAGAGLALTYVRSAWLGLVVGLAGLAIASRGRALPRLLPLALALGVSFGVLSAAGGTSAAVLERVETLGSLGGDTSAQARTATPAELLPELARLPFGYGLGTAGEATRLSEDDGLAASDNGYLSLAYQLGIPGALLVLAAVLAPLVLAVRGALARPRSRLPMLVGVIAAFLALLATGDQFYGLAGLVLWYTLGAALAGVRSSRAPA